VASDDRRAFVQQTAHLAVLPPKVIVLPLKVIVLPLNVVVIVLPPKVVVLPLKAFSLISVVLRLLHVILTRPDKRIIFSLQLLQRKIKAFYSVLLIQVINSF